MTYHVARIIAKPLMCCVRYWKKVLRSRGKQISVTGLAGSLVTFTRPPGQHREGSTTERASNAGVARHETADCRCCWYAVSSLSCSRTVIRRGHAAIYFAPFVSEPTALVDRGLQSVASVCPSVSLFPLQPLTQLQICVLIWFILTQNQFR